MADQKENKVALTYEDLNFRNTVIDRLAKDKVAKQRVVPFRKRVADAANLKGVGQLRGFYQNKKNNQ
jgi:hypothetical protein